jgi:4-hydroxy-tetrahydrodipicolinate synthase
MTSEPLWRGVAVALVTLFDADGAVDVPATAAHAARLVDLGMRAVLVAGSTGEAEALTDPERLALVTAIRQACPDVPVIAGATGAWAAPVTEHVAASVAAGADAVLVPPPRRVGDIVGFYRTVRKAAGSVPVLAYHYPGVAGAAVPVEALTELAVDGLKDSTGDPERLLRTLQAWSGWTYVGSSTVVSYAGQVGATGAILAVANAVPEECVAAFDGDGTAQRRLIGPHLAARSQFPHGLKELVSRRFGTATGCRLG